MSAEDTNKDHLDETRVIDTQTQDAQAHDTHADKTTYVNVAYQKEDGTYEGAWITAVMSLSLTRPQQSPPGRRRQSLPVRQQLSWLQVLARVGQRARWPLPLRRSNRRQYPDSRVRVV